MDTLILRSLVLAVASLLCSSQLHASPLVINDRPTFAALGPQKIYTLSRRKGSPLHRLLYPVSTALLCEADPTLHRCSNFHREAPTRCWQVHPQQPIHSRNR